LSRRVESVSRDERINDVLCRVISEIRATNRLGRITVVTPTLQASYYLRRSLARTGLFNVDFRRLEDVAELLAGNSVEGARLTDLEASEFVYSISTESSHGTALGGDRYSPQLQTALHSTFRDLENLTQHQLDSLGSAGSFQAELVSRFDEYRNRTKQFSSGRRVAAEAVEILLRQGGDDISRRLLGRVVLIEVAPVAPELTTLFDALAELVDTVNVSVGNENSGSTESHEQVAMLAVNTVPNEVKEITRQIVGLARDGVRFPRIAVLFEDEAYADRISESLMQSGIPVSGPDRSALRATPVGRFVIGLLNVFANDFDRNEVTSWFSSSPVIDPVSGHPIPGARWDAISRAAGVTRSVGDSWRPRLERYARSIVSRAKSAERLGERGESEIESAESESSYTLQLLNFISSLHSQRNKAESASWTTHVGWIRSLMSRYLDVENVGETRPFERMMNVLDRLENLDSTGLKNPGFDHFVDVLRDQLNRKSAGLRSLGQGVYVGPTWTAAGCPFDYVFVTGMVEGKFPSLHRSDPLLPDHLKRLIDPDEKVLPTRVRISTDSQQVFESIKASARELRLLWPQTLPGESREFGPARWFLNEVRRVAGNPSLKASELTTSNLRHLSIVTSDHADPEQSANAAEYDQSRIVEWIRSGAVKQELTSDVRSTIVDDAVKYTEARDGEDWTEFDGKISVKDTPSLSGSATAFETYAACPYRYFLSRRLRVEETKSPEDEISLDALEFGTLIHQVLEDFFEWRNKEDVLPPTDKQETWLQNAVARKIEALKEKVPGRSDGAWTVDQSRAWLILRQWVRREKNVANLGEMNQVFAEFGFGYGDEPPVEVVTDQGRKVRFRGQVDRVDQSQDGSKVTIYDYKSGGSSSYTGLDKDPVKNGTKIQLPLYSRAVRRAFPDAEIQAAYWFVRESGSNELKPRPEAYDETKADQALTKAIDVVAGGIEKGVFPANPGKSGWVGGRSSFGSCGFCEFQRVCPQDKQDQWNRKKNSSDVLNDYLALVEPDEDEVDD